jgi:micrococcal nuclease
MGIIAIWAAVYQMQVDRSIDIGLATSTPNSIGIYYDVTKVTDGDTIHVKIEGNDETVRLIGINTPETVDPRRPVQCFGKEASNRMKELAKGKIVRLEYDNSQSLRDVYGRLLAYVYLEDGEMLNRKMIAEGYAYEYTYMTPYKYQKEFRGLQKLAQTSGRGLWAQDTCAGSKDMPTN